MQRITISIDDDLAGAIDRLIEHRGYTSRSEALRDIVRDTLAREDSHIHASDTCFATLSYVYEHETRELAKRLTSDQHAHHDLSVATLHVHLDDKDCLEVTVLKGDAPRIRSFANGIISQRGVRAGNLHIVPSSANPAVNKPHRHRHR